MNRRRSARTIPWNLRTASRVVALAIVWSAGAGISHDLRAADLGRLFFDPQQRAELDRLRLQPPKAPPRPRQIVETPIVAPQPPKDVTLNGYVTRSGGRSTVWINDQPTNTGQASVTSAPMPVPFGDAGRRVELKVGQSFGEGAGTRDPLLGGKIQVNR
ncbi:MAG: hypothetical protein ACKVQU_22370 [Burkholderiales bacterium]